MSEEVKLKFSIGEDIAFEAQGQREIVCQSYDKFLKQLDAINDVIRLISAPEPKIKRATVADRVTQKQPPKSLPHREQLRILAPWVDVIPQLISGQLVFAVGDVVRSALLDDTPVDWVVTEVTDVAYRFESRDCLGYTPHTNIEAFFAKIWDNLPASLKDQIITTRRRHIDADGKEYFKDSYLFLPAASEIFPPEKCLGDKGLYKQLDYYKDIHNRVRAANKGDDTAEWYWTESPYAGGSTGWCLAYYNGHADHFYASYGRIAAPVCFRIYRKS